MKNVASKLEMFASYICTIAWILITIQNYRDKKDEVILMLQALVILISLVNSIAATVRYKNKVKKR